MMESDRTLAERYRLYVLRDSRGKPVCVATTPDPEGVGTAIVKLAADGELTGDDLIGVMDACPGGIEGVPGTWLVNPYPKVQR